MTAAPRVRMRLLLPDAQALSSVLLDLSPAAAERLCDQLWLRTVLVEQRRGTPRAERTRFDAQADQILQQLDPDLAREEIASEPRSVPRGGPLNTVEDRRDRQEHERALIAQQFALDAAAAIAADQRCSGGGCNPGDLVCDPFMGIGSTAWVALEQRRRAVGFELKESYHRLAQRNARRGLASERFSDQLDLLAADASATSSSSVSTARGRQ
jgi:hypothetical protein